MGCQRLFMAVNTVTVTQVVPTTTHAINLLDSVIADLTSLADVVRKWNLAISTLSRIITRMRLNWPI